MKTALKKYFAQYFSKNISVYVTAESENSLPYLRDKLFESVLFFTTIIGFLVYIPSFIVCIITNQPIIGIFDTAAMVLVLYMFFSRSISVNIKKIIFSLTFYVLSIVLVIFLGAKGPGILILICVSVLVTLFISKKAGLYMAASNSLIILLLMAFLPFDSLKFIPFQEYTVVTWVGVGGNFIAFNILLVLSVSFLVEELNKSLVTEKDLLEKLQEESYELLIAKQRAEESDKLKLAFLANMSHEIRTPMNGILGFSTLLREEGLSGEDRREYIDMIKKSSDRMLNIINEIVDISSIETGNVNINKTDFNVYQKLNNIFEMFMPLAGSKKLELKLADEAKQFNYEIYTDSEKLVSIISILLKNAIKYTDKGSIEFGCAAHKDSSISFFVKDTGIGIPSERQEAIFDRFVQADIADVQARQGAGLGLAIAKSYIEMLKGRIWVESEEGKGTTFYFTLQDIKSGKSESMLNSKSDNKESVQERKLNVMIVEDDDISAMFITKIINKISRKIITAKDGASAIELCRNNSDIDIILMDIKMQGIDGYEAAKRIRTFNNDVVIIAQTAFCLSGDKEKALNSGCNDYITKPINEGKLYSLINQYKSN